MNKVFCITFIDIIPLQKVFLQIYETVWYNRHISLSRLQSPDLVCISYNLKTCTSRFSPESALSYLHWNWVHRDPPKCFMLIWVFFIMHSHVCHKYVVAMAPTYTVYLESLSVVTFYIFSKGRRTRGGLPTFLTSILFICSILIFVCSQFTPRIKGFRT